MIAMGSMYALDAHPQSPFFPAPPPPPPEFDLYLGVPAVSMARPSGAALLAAAVLAASAFHLVYAGVQSTTGLQYPGVTGLIPA